MKLALFVSLLLTIAAYGQDSAAKCSEDSSVTYPLRGWVGYTNTGTPIDGMSVEVFTAGAKAPVATAVTDKEGRFSFPKVKPGKYVLKGAKRENEKYVIRADDTVIVTTQSTAIACLVADAEEVQSK